LHAAWLPRRLDALTACRGMTNRVVGRTVGGAPMRLFVCAAFVVVCTVSFAMADEFFATIKKIDGNKVTVTQKKKGEEPKEMTLNLTADTKIVKGKFAKSDDGKFSVEAGDPIEGGKEGLIKMVDKSGEKGVAPFVVTDGDKIKELRITGGKGKKKKGDGK